MPESVRSTDVTLPATHRARNHAAGVGLGSIRAPDVSGNARFRWFLSDFGAKNEEILPPADSEELVPPLSAGYSARMALTTRGRAFPGRKGREIGDFLGFAVPDSRVAVWPPSLERLFFETQNSGLDPPEIA